MESRIRSSEDDISPLLAIAQQLLTRCQERGWRLATAESLTGGMVGSTLTGVPGSSAVYLGGVVGYAISIKTAVLGVPEAAIQDHGVTSSEVALEMARGVRSLTGADVALATTGVAGPGSDNGLPAGTAWIAVVTPDVESTRLVQSAHGITGDREGVRRDVVEAVIEEALSASGPAGNAGDQTDA